MRKIYFYGTLHYQPSEPYFFGAIYIFLSMLMLVMLVVIPNAMNSFMSYLVKCYILFIV